MKKLVLGLFVIFSCSFSIISEKICDTHLHQSGYICCDNPRHFLDFKFFRSDYTRSYSGIGNATMGWLHNESNFRIYLEIKDTAKKNRPLTRTYIGANSKIRMGYTSSNYRWKIITAEFVD